MTDDSGRCSISGSPVETSGGVLAGVVEAHSDRHALDPSGPRVVIATGVLDQMRIGEALHLGDAGADARRRMQARARRHVGELRTLAVTGVLALGVPVATAAYTGSRTDELAEDLSTAAGVPASIGSIDADLGGSIRLTDVRLGELVSADAIEGSVGMGSLLDGHPRADEIRVEGPRVALQVEPDGDSDVARLARRLLGHGVRATPGGGEATSVRRIVVAGGTLDARIAGIGELTAEGVELVPEADGVRIVTGAVRIVRRSDPRLGLDIAFDRSAAELALPQIKFGRVLAVGGAGTVGIGANPPLVVQDLAVGRRVGGGALEIRGEVDDGGVTRAIAADVTSHSVALRGERIPLRAFAALAPHGIELADSRATGTLVVHRNAVTVDGSLDHLVIDHRTVAAEPVLAGLVDVHAEASLTPDRLQLDSAALKLGAITLTANGWLGRGARLAGALDVRLAEAACADLMSSLPDPVRGPLDGMVLDGTLAAHAHLAIDLAAPDGDGVTLTNALTGGCRVTAEPPAADVTKLADAGKPETALRGLPDHVGGAFIAAEDGRFYDHAGFDLHQIARSLEIDLREHRLLRGGSTISQQLVKNAFLTQRRSFDRKLQEAVLTWRLEARLPKKQILERYLNLIELGPRTFGITAAARYWFDTTPRELTAKQSAFLAALTAQPTSMSARIRRAGGLDPDSADRVGIVLRAMRRDGLIGPATYDLAKTEPLHFAATAVPAER